MKTLHVVALSILLFPFMSSAQGIGGYVTSVMGFINDTLIPFILGIAFLVFVINTIRFFVVEGHSEQGHEKAKAHALYSVLAFVLLVIFWGVINLLTTAVGLSGQSAPKSDYEARAGAGTPAPCAPPPVDGSLEGVPIPGLPPC